MGERKFWFEEIGLDPLRIAAALYKNKGNLEAMLGMIHDLHRKHQDTSNTPF